MDLQKIKMLIEFVGRSRISELVVSQDGTTVRISNSISKRAIRVLRDNCLFSHLS